MAISFKSVPMPEIIARMDDAASLSVVVGNYYQEMAAGSGQ
jgi:hypothetical protein